MAKFGELIEKDKTLFFFYTKWNQESILSQNMVIDIAAELGDTCSVIKIDCDLNQELCNALRIKSLPTYLIYSKSQMIFRQSGETNKEQIMEFLNAIP